MCVTYVRTYVCMYVCTYVHTQVHKIVVQTTQNATYVRTVTPGSSENGLSQNLIYPTICCESSLLCCVQSNLIYPTPGLSDTFHEEQMWSDN